MFTTLIKQQTTTKVRKLKINGKECTSHKVQITSHFEGMIHIPNEMDAMDLKSLTQQANQIFRMSQMLITENETGENIEEEKTITPGNWSNKDTKSLIFMYKSGFTSKQIAEELNCTDQRVRSKIKYLKLSKFHKSKKSKFRIWSKDKIDKLKELYEQGKTVSEITKEIDLNYLQIYNKLSYMNLKPILIGEKKQPKKILGGSKRLTDEEKKNIYTKFKKNKDKIFKTKLAKSLDKTLPQLKKCISNWQTRGQI